MNILYYCYWGIDEGLTRASLIPNLPLIHRHFPDHKIILVTTERNQDKPESKDLQMDFVEHVPLVPGWNAHYVSKKAYEFMRTHHVLAGLAKKHDIGLLMARTSLPGGIVAKVAAKTGLPYVVESFEPHSDYMAGVGSWKEGGFSYRLAKALEKRQISTAAHLITVTENYKSHLEKEYAVASERLAVIPCTVDPDAFAFDDKARQTKREEIGFPAEAPIGVYLGKFGDLYYDEESFQVFRDSLAVWPELHFMLLTPNDPALIKDRLKQFSLPEERFFVRKVPHHEVPAYLSAADFAYSLVRQMKANPFQCPIKHGEYWANGLPILMPDGLADDYRILEAEKAGALLNLELSNVESALKKVRAIINEDDYRTRIHQLAVRYRHPDIARKVYASVFQRFL